MIRFIKPTNSDELIQVDEIDYDYLMQWNWQLDNDKSVGRCTSKEGVRYIVRMKKEIASRMGLVVGKSTKINNIDRNSLNLTRTNLRIATHNQILTSRKPWKKNITGYRGVMNTKYKTYRASISINGTKLHLGHFKTAVEAAKRYDEAAKQYFGEFASLNFPE